MFFYISKFLYCIGVGLLGIIFLEDSIFLLDTESLNYVEFNDYFCYLGGNLGGPCVFINLLG
jgi:hypothetical protein